MTQPIKSFAINLKERTDRKQHILEQFKKKKEFELEIIKAIKDDVGAIGLWKTIRGIVRTAKDKGYPFILVCEDDHEFTDSFEYDHLIESINEARAIEADLLLGGLSHFSDAIPLSDRMFWISNFTGFQFAIVFAKFYDSILSLNLERHENIDIKMKELSTNIFCMYPFISIQKEFGYSDVTPRNAKNGVVNQYFEDSEKRMTLLLYLKKHFTKILRVIR